MDFSTVRKRIDTHGYRNLDEFEDDFNLIIANCMKYNAKDNFFYRAAVRMRDLGGVILRKARRDAERIGFDFPSGMHLPEPPKLEPPPTFSWDDGKRHSKSCLTKLLLLPFVSHSCVSHVFCLGPLSVDRLLNPVSRKQLSQEEQLKRLLDHLDLLSSMKSSPSRNKRLKLLKKTINDVRSETSVSTSVSASASSQRLPPDITRPAEEFKEFPVEPVSREERAYLQAFLLHTVVVF